MSEPKKAALAGEYDRYARVLAGRLQPEGVEWTSPTACHEDLEQYQSVYLPYEILHWGGTIEAMFPESCRELHRRTVPLAQFVSFWFREPRPLAGSYDFFLLKIACFVEFIHEVAPDLDRTAAQEADELRTAYHAANEPAIPAVSEPA